MCNSARRAAWAPKFMDLMQQGVRPFAGLGNLIRVKAVVVICARIIFSIGGMCQLIRIPICCIWMDEIGQLLFKLFSAQSFFDSNVIQLRYSASGCPFKEHISASYLPKSINLE